MSDQEENRVSFVDVLALVVRYRVLIIIGVIVALAASAVLYVALPPNVISSVYSTGTVVTMRTRYHSLPGAISAFMSEPEYRLQRWDRYPEDLGQLFIDAGYETEMNAERLGDMLLDGEMFAISKQSGAIVFTVTGVDAEVAIAALDALAEEALRVSVRQLESQAQDYIERVYRQYGTQPGGPIPEGMPPEIQGQLIVLEPYAAGEYTTPIRANEPVIRHRTQDHRRTAAAAVFAGILSVVIVICLIDAYRRSVAADPEKMAKLKAAWKQGTPGKTGNDNKNQETSPTT